MIRIVDNFEIIGRFIQEQAVGNDCYYHLQVIHRGKDDGTGANSNEIKTYMIDRYHTIERYKDEIIKLCQMFNARAYINLSPKDKYNTCLGMLDTISKALREGNFNYLQKIWNSVAGSEISGKALYVVDVDDDKVERPLTLEVTDAKNQHGTVIDILQCINEKCMPFDVTNKLVLVVPTLNGQHLITTGFDRETFNTFFPMIDVHKNNPTLLYASVTTKD